MINLASMTKMGAKFRLVNVDSTTGEITKDSDWFCNVILNTAVETMPTGFNELPIPVLGSSMVPEDITQTGVLTPLPNLNCFTNRELWPAKYTKINDYTANVSWGHRYSYRNDNATSVEIGEISIPKFNRAVFKNEAGTAFTWTISPTETLIVEMDFNIAINGGADQISINLHDQDDLVIKTIKMNLRVCDKLIDAQVPVWWKALSIPATKVYYTVDPNFTGTIRPPASTMKEVAISSTFEYVGRDIKIRAKHRGEVGGQNIKGLLYHFGCLSPVLTTVFTEPLYVGGGYTFEVNATLTW